MLITKNTSTLSTINKLHVGIVIDEHLPEKDSIYKVDVILVSNAQILTNVPVEISNKSSNNYGFVRLKPAEYTYTAGKNKIPLNSIEKKNITHYIASDGDKVLVDYINNNRNLPVIVGMLHSEYKDITHKIEGTQEWISPLNLKDVEELSWIGNNLIVFKSNGEITIEHRDKDNNLLWLLSLDDSNIYIKDKAGNTVFTIENGKGTSSMTPVVLGNALVNILGEIYSAHNLHTHTTAGATSSTPSMTLSYNSGSVLSQNIKISG